MQQPSDNEILDSVPDHIQVGAMMKASAASEQLAGNKRIMYIEASHETVDHEGEVVLQKALMEQKDYFLRHGNIDIDHYTLMGPRAGISDYLDYEIGRPIDVQFDDTRTLVKAELYVGDSAMAKRADTVWNSLTRQQPPARWYASVGGAVMEKSVKTDPDTGKKVAVISRVRWGNLGISRTPVNQTVPEISLAPYGVFAKSMGGYVLSGSQALKSLEAGYGSDVATLEGGAALRTQSLDGEPKSYYGVRERLSAALRHRIILNPSSREMVDYLVDEVNLSPVEAANHVSRFMRDLQDAMKRRRA